MSCANLEKAPRFSKITFLSFIKPFRLVNHRPTQNFSVTERTALFGGDHGA